MARRKASEDTNEATNGEWSVIYDLENENGYRTQLYIKFHDQEFASYKFESFTPYGEHIVFYDTERIFSYTKKSE